MTNMAGRCPLLCADGVFPIERNCLIKSVPLMIGQMSSRMTSDGLKASAVSMVCSGVEQHSTSQYECRAMASTISEGVRCGEYITMHLEFIACLLSLYK
jgi:hypothetical protein